MSKKGLTEIICVLDRSGSMCSIINDAIGGFNSFLQSQQNLEEGEAKMTIAMFDDQYELICESKKIAKVKAFDNTTYVPRGSTALNDAIGKTIQTVAENFDKRKKGQQPENVIFVILTDGDENSSREYDLTMIKKMIEKQEKESKWEFVFLSSDVNAFQQGAGYGIHRTSRMAANGQGTVAAYACLDQSVSQCRGTGQLGDIDENIE